MRVSQLLGPLLVTLVGSASLSVSGADFGSQRTEVNGVSIDLRPPEGYVDICSQDQALCQKLTSGYPASAKTLGYFVRAGEWQSFQNRKGLGFNHYLIAQHAGSMSPERLPAFKKHLRANQGRLPDQTELPKTLREKGRVELGIFDETPDSISFGIIMKLESSGNSTNNMSLVSANAVVRLPNCMLSLYVYQSYQGESDIKAVQEFTNAWVRQILQKNKEIRAIKALD